ncbi:RbsD/FucU family protein [Bacillota bacterium Meth-B3]|nr:RbsD/FucU domain-containing protein [Christensenellaceae bacterium]MEA5066015.1 RbsD/FucU domain-containing protein [Eubacteriales bacterium]MEA5069840.1 RbsD/FucU domain-containing protein [Christensenellaceae bacterium]
MLNHIPKILPPELVKIMMQMGHGDEMVIGDGNYPCDAMGTRVVRVDGHCVPEVLDAVLTLMPLDAYVERPTALMQVVPGDPVGEPEVWDTYAGILKNHGHDTPSEMVERFAFYERAKRAFVVVATSEPRQYANIILKKGIVK